eukprot:1084758-Rhodomonas_salina.2
MMMSPRPGQRHVRPGRRHGHSESGSVTASFKSYQPASERRLRPGPSTVLLCQWHTVSDSSESVTATTGPGHWHRDNSVTRGTQAVAVSYTHLRAHETEADL